MGRGRLVIGAAVAASAVTLVGIGVAAAATLGVSARELWTSSQTLTKGICLLRGTSETTDTWVDRFSPGATHAGTQDLQTERRNGRDRWAFVAFDLASCGLPPTGGADRAVLTFVLASAPGQSRTLTVTPVRSSWDASLTWRGAQSLSYGPATTTFDTGTRDGALLTATVTADVDALIKDPGAFVGWRISDGGASSNHSTLSLDSSESAAPPTLAIVWEK